jgi:hypothetical protein
MSTAHFEFPIVRVGAPLRSRWRKARRTWQVHALDRCWRVLTNADER